MRLSCLLRLELEHSLTARPQYPRRLRQATRTLFPTRTRLRSADHLSRATSLNIHGPEPHLASATYSQDNHQLALYTSRLSKASPVLRNSPPYPGAGSTFTLAKSASHCGFYIFLILDSYIGPTTRYRPRARSSDQPTESHH